MRSSISDKILVGQNSCIFMNTAQQGKTSNIILQSQFGLSSYKTLSDCKNNHLVMVKISLKQIVLIRYDLILNKYFQSIYQINVKMMFKIANIVSS